VTWPGSTVLNSRSTWPGVIYMTYLYIIAAGIIVISFESQQPQSCRLAGELPFRE